MLLLSIRVVCMLLNCQFTKNKNNNICCAIFAPKIYSTIIGFVHWGWILPFCPDSYREGADEGKCTEPIMVEHNSKIMKKIYFTLIALMYILPIYSQLFEKIESGDIVADFSDSRSVNFVDVNNDGWEDIFISNGINPGVENLFYLNNGAGNYSKVTSGDIVGHPAPFDGATFADIDNDGNLDAFAVTWYGIKNYLYYGNGDGTFNYDSGAAPSMGTTYSETASWGDMDNDGDLDLYVTNSTNLNGTSLKNDLYKNNGDGSFTKINGGVAVIQAHPSRSVNWTDYDNDGDLDLFVSNESNRPDDLYRNDGNGNFSVAPNAPSQSIRSTMSSSWGDIDNDGDLDLFVANSGFYSEQKNQLFKNNGDGTFSEITSGPAADFGCSYGSNFGDYDNDGDLDLVVANGFCNGSIFNFLYLNDGQGNFS
ncbi:MAG TPA: VCBS repeat-containing protein, partial [Bacteroidetes bacterium]|nr:VCBS repeat-containing protein [Bacteroidota bacterium]